MLVIKDIKVHDDITIRNWKFIYFPQVELEYLLLRGEKPLFIRFYDIPGIAMKNDVGVEELLMFIKGEIKPGAKVLTCT